MQATVQTRLVNNTSASLNAKVLPTTLAPKPQAAPKSGTRFLGFLMSALGAFAV